VHVQIAEGAGGALREKNPNQLARMRAAVKK
jgi:hypothetical protein